MSNRVRNRKKSRLKHLRKHGVVRRDIPVSVARRSAGLGGLSLPPEFGQTTINELLAGMAYIREFSPILARTMIERTEAWCKANGVEPHPRLSSAATYMSGAMIVATRSKLPEGQSEAGATQEAFFTIMKRVNEADPVAVADAVLQMIAATPEGNETPH
jgi:hypothetical protein